jgi:hypothetical protein
MLIEAQDDWYVKQLDPEQERYTASDVSALRLEGSVDATLDIGVSLLTMMQVHAHSCWNSCTDDRTHVRVYSTQYPNGVSSVYVLN